MGSLFKNWKTTLFGIGAGALNLLANGAKWQQVLLSVAVAALGLVSKDSNVTGGTSAQTPEAQARINKDQ
jgi:hypothetical protein